MKHKLLLLLMIQLHINCFSVQPPTEKKLKILMVLDIFPCAIQTFVLSQIKGLIDRGHDVHISARRKWHNEVDSLIVDEYDLLQKTYYKVLPYNLNSFDIVYCQFGYLAGRFVQIKREKKAPWKLVVAFRGYDATGIFEKNPNIYKDLFAMGDLFLPVCDCFKNILIKAGCSAQRTKVHHSAIDCAKFQFKMRGCDTKSDVHIVTIARLIPEKGVEIALDAVMQIMQKNINIKYTIIGDGPQRQRLERKIRSANLSNRISVLGFLPHEEVCKLLSTADIFLLASVTIKNKILEGIPNALMEAMALGIPVVSTYHGGIPELVKDGVSGFLVQEHNAQALVEKLQYLIDHKELWSMFGLHGRGYIEKEHNIETTNDRLEQILYELVRK